MKMTENFSVTSNSSQKESNTPKTLAWECPLGVFNQNPGLFSLASMLFTACERRGGTQRCNKCNLSWVVVSAIHKDRVDLLLLNENSISHQIVTGTHLLPFTRLANVGNCNTNPLAGGQMLPSFIRFGTDDF